MPTWVGSAGMRQETRPGWFRVCRVTHRLRGRWNLRVDVAVLVESRYLLESCHQFVCGGGVDDDADAVEAVVVRRVDVYVAWPSRPVASRRPGIKGRGGQASCSRRACQRNPARSCPR